MRSPGTPAGLTGRHDGHDRRTTAPGHSGGRPERSWPVRQTGPTDAAAWTPAPGTGMPPCPAPRRLSRTGRRRRAVSAEFPVRGGGPGSGLPFVPFSGFPWWCRPPGGDAPAGVPIATRSRSLRAEPCPGRGGVIRVGGGRAQWCGLIGACGYAVAGFPQDDRMVDGFTAPFPGGLVPGQAEARVARCPFTTACEVRGPVRARVHPGLAPAGRGGPCRRSRAGRRAIPGRFLRFVPAEGANRTRRSRGGRRPLLPGGGEGAGSGRRRHHGRQAGRRRERARSG